VPRTLNVTVHQVLTRLFALLGIFALIEIDYSRLNVLCIQVQMDGANEGINDFNFRKQS
jgi:hypothetical protein